ncbi:hypothetical protein JKF63_01550 [Porcisia hertigi]|uniref:Uncharacterized protein n=1 Tax=Porcisia hertigi TaxID=2761500 RepID=A0A836HJZ4_9TRYP|nr:hypothetical protein JKF63_01550 [Porcisia hertigi]
MRRLLTLRTLVSPLVPYTSRSLSASVAPNEVCACGGVRATSPCRTLTTIPVAAARSNVRDTTSFELESELSLAQQDLQQPHPTLHHIFSNAKFAVSAKPRYASTPTPSQTASTLHPDQLRGVSSTSVCAKPLPTPLSAPLTPPSQSPPLPLAGSQLATLPTLLRRPRWCNVLHERYTASVSGYVDACNQVLRDIFNTWEKCVGSRRREERVQDHAEKFEEDSHFAKHVGALLRHAHADALLVLLEGVTGTHGGSEVCTNGGAPFCCALILHLVEILARRSAELSGKHMAHLSRLLLSCPQLLITAPSAQGRRSPELVATIQERVWEVFTLLCYATRRSLRRRQNIDCLEALLCGVYLRVYHSTASAPHGRRGRRRSCRIPSMPRSSVDAIDGGGQRRHTFLIIPPGLVAEVRKAALCHLVHRSFLNSAPAKSRAAEATIGERADLLLAWALLLAREDMDPVVRAAVVHRLRKGPRLADSGAPSGALSMFLLSWRRLALGLEAVPSPSGVGRQRSGTVPPAGAEIFQRVDRAARDTDGWAVSSADRCLLAVLLKRSVTQKQSLGALSSTMKRASLRGVEASRVYPEGAVAQRVLNEGAAALQAYARLRWGMPCIDEPEQLLYGDAPPELDTLHAAGTQRGACMSAAERATVEEWEDILETATSVPLHALCLAEVLCVRLMRCFHSWKGVSPEGSVLPRASIDSGQAFLATMTVSQQRRIFAAVWRLAAYTRAEVATTAFLDLKGEARTPWETYLPSGEDSQPLSIAELFSAPVWPHIHKGTCCSLIGVLCQDAEGAVRVVREWMAYREMMALPLSLASIQRLCKWLVALPGPMHSSELVSVLQEWAAMEKSKLSGAQLLSQACLASWDQVMRTALEQHTAQALLAGWEAPCPAHLMSTVQSCSPCGQELRCTYAGMTGPASAQLRRLQWISEANSSAVREWRWNMGIASSPTDWATVDRSARSLHPTAEIPAAVLLVQATEGDLTDTEDETVVQLLCRRYFPHFSDSNMLSWSDQLVCKALENVRVTAYNTGTNRWMDSALCLPPCGLPEADGDAHARPPRLGYCCEAIVSAPVLHYLHSVRKKTVSSDTTITAIFSPAELADALWTLAAYTKSLERARHAGVDDNQGGKGADGHRLLWAAAAYVNCLNDAWCLTTSNAVSAASAPSFDKADGNTLLACLPIFYRFALHLYEALLSGKDKPLNSGSEALRIIPSLPSELHAAAFRVMVSSPDIQRHTIDHTLLLADCVSRKWTARTASAVSWADEIPTVCVPLSVYQFVLATYAASRTPLPQRVRACCEAVLRREEKSHASRGAKRGDTCVIRPWSSLSLHSNHHT